MVHSAPGPPSSHLPSSVKMQVQSVMCLGGGGLGDGGLDKKGGGGLGDGGLHMPPGAHPWESPDMLLKTLVKFMLANSATQCATGSTLLPTSTLAAMMKMMKLHRLHAIWHGPKQRACVPLKQQQHIVHLSCRKI